MRGLVHALLVVAAAGCASSGAVSKAPAPPPASQTVYVASSGGQQMGLQMVSEASANGGEVALSPDQALTALRAVYDSLGIPVTTLDPASHTIANSGFKIRRRLGKTRLSQYLDCGTMQAAPSADSYDVFLSVSTTARAKGTGSLVMTTVQAQARPVMVSGDNVRCSTTTRLERRIVEMLLGMTKH